MDLNNELVQLHSVSGNPGRDVNYCGNAIEWYIILTDPLTTDRTTISQYPQCIPKTRTVNGDFMTIKSIWSLILYGDMRSFIEYHTNKMQFQMSASGRCYQPGKTITDYILTLDPTELSSMVNWAVSQKCQTITDIFNGILIPSTQCKKFSRRPRGHLISQT